MFPSGYFYIISRKHGYALDVFNGETKADVNIIVWPQKFHDSDNQLWSFDNGRLVNKKSGHVLDIRSSAFKREKAIIQNKRKEKTSQEWAFENGFICSKEYPSMVLDIKGDSEDGGAQVLLYNRKESDNLNQLWFVEPYQQFEASLSIAASEGPLHKKSDFGQPRPGYGAEVGVPPMLQSLPADSHVVGAAGAGAGGSSAPAAQQPTSSSTEQQQQPPPPQQQQQPYAPPPPSSSSYPSQPPPPAAPAGDYPPQQGSYPPQPSAYPPQPSAYPPQQSGYPPQQGGYPPQQGGYPPQQSGYPPQQGGYPPAPEGFSSQPAPPHPAGGFYVPGQQHHNIPMHSRNNPDYPPQYPAYPPQ